eukprot:13373509-Ditylum_brightwellii.AAC.1
MALATNKRCTIDWRSRQDVKDMIKYIQVVARNNSLYGAHLLHTLLINNQQLIASLDELQTSESNAIINSIKSFVSKKLKAK